MISKISSSITEKLIARSTINDEDKELYVYGFFVLLSQLFYLIFAIVIGSLFHIAVESIVFCVAFFSIRRYAGGYHAATEIRCEIMSSFSIFACIAVIKLSTVYDFQPVLLILSAVSAICIACLCPLDTPEKPLSEKETKHFRKISLAILLVIVIAIVCAYFFKLKVLFAPCCMSLMLEAILISAGKIKKLR